MKYLKTYVDSLTKLLKFVSSKRVENFVIVTTSAKTVPENEEKWDRKRDW